MKRTMKAPAFKYFPSEWHLSTVMDTGEFVFFSGVTGCQPDYSVDDDAETQAGTRFNF